MKTTKMSKTNKKYLNKVLGDLEETRKYILNNTIIIAMKCPAATTTEYFVNDKKDYSLIELNKEIGSKLCYLYTAINDLKKLINEK